MVVMIVEEVTEEESSLLLVGYEDWRTYVQRRRGMEFKPHWW